MNNQGARERLIEEFEREWRNGNCPTVATFVRERLTSELNANANVSVEGSLVHELIAVDLEWRWKNSRRHGFAAWRVEKYWHELPSLGSLETIPMSLVEEEYRVRRLWGDRPECGEFMARFPQHAAMLTTRLAEVDRDLQAELGDGGAWGALNSTMAMTAASRQCIATPSLPPVGAAWARFEEYLLHEMIGAGQMGRVYRATHLPTGEASAIKYLRKAFHRDRQATARFLDEARVLATLSHPGLVPIRAVGRTPGGGHFLAMELLPGPDLSKLAAEAPVAIADGVRWVYQAAEAITYANASGVIHCDLKPGNLVLDRDRRVRVTDFGLARNVNDGCVAAGDRIAGTAPFMAPEQVCDWWGTMGPSTDVYGLGAVLYTLLAGRPPFMGATVADVLAQVVSGQKPDEIRQLRPEISAPLAATIARALAKQPGERPRSALDFGRELLQALPPGAVGKAT